MISADMHSRLRALMAGMARAPMRFPVTLCCAFLWAALTIADQHGFEPFERTVRQQLQVFLILGFFASLAAKLFCEGRRWPPRIWLPLGIAALALPALAVFGTVESPAFLFMGPGLVLLMTVAPFARRDAVDHALWQFNFWSWTSAAFGLLVAVLLAGGLSAAFRAVEILFDADIPGSVWEDTWIIALSVVWPWQTLAGVPGALEPRDEDYCPRWVGHVISRLLVPIALVYLLLLYGYTAKTAIQWELPRGTISWLVAGFAGFGLAVWMAAWPLRNAGNPLVRAYHRFFHPALFVPVALLAIGIAERVGDYGITESRYGLILLALWLGGIALYGTVRRPARLAAAPLAFGLMLVVGSVGPWGAGAVSLRSQLGQLEKVLTDAGYLVDGRLEPYAGHADFEQSKRVSSIVRYLATDDKKGVLKAWLADAGATTTAVDNSSAIVAALGLDYVGPWDDAPDSKSFAYDIGEVRAVATHGFDLAARFDVYPPGAVVTLSTGEDGADYKLYALGDDATMLLAAPDGAQIRLDLGGLIRTLQSDFGKRNAAPSRSAMSLEEAGDRLAVRLLLHSLGGHWKDNAPRLDHASGWILIARGR